MKFSNFEFRDRVGYVFFNESCKSDSDDCEGRQAKEEEQVGLAGRFLADGGRRLAVSGQRIAHRIACPHLGAHRKRPHASIALHRLRHRMGFRRVLQVNDDLIILSRTSTS